jgi:hypothetical protein
MLRRVPSKAKSLMERKALAEREQSRSVKLSSLKQEPNQASMALSMVVYISENGFRNKWTKTGSGAPFVGISSIENIEMTWDPTAYNFTIERRVTNSTPASLSRITMRRRSSRPSARSTSPSWTRRSTQQTSRRRANMEHFGEVADRRYRC